MSDIWVKSVYVHILTIALDNPLIINSIKMFQMIFNIMKMNKTEVTDVVVKN